jgi:hypothetical protein
MVLKRILARWGRKGGKLKSFTSSITVFYEIPYKKSGEPNAPSAIHDPLDPIFYPIDKGKIIADCLENQFTAHDLCDCYHRRHVEAQVEALLATPLKIILLSSDPVTSQRNTVIEIMKDMALEMNVSDIFQDDILCI